MAVTPSRILYDIYSMSIYDRSNGEFQGQISCLGSAGIEASGGLEYMYCNKLIPAAAEPQPIELSITGTFRSMDDSLFEWFTGANVSVNAAEANGSVDPSVTDIQGSTWNSGTTGVASAAIDVATASNTKTMTYVMVAQSATTFDVYQASDITGISNIDDNNKITTVPLTLPTGGTVVIPGTGIELTGGSAVALNPGDTCRIQSRHYNNPGSSIITPYANPLTAFGALIYTTRSSGDIFEIDAPYCTPDGSFGIALESKAFSENDLEIAIQDDPIKGYPYRIRAVRGAGS